MPKLIEQPTLIKAVGNKPKRIKEHIGRVNSGHEQISIAHMTSPAGWQEPVEVGFFPANSGTLIMSGSSAATYWFEGITSGTVTESGTRVYFQSPDGVNPGTYDVTIASTTTLMNVRRNVGIW